MEYDSNIARKEPLIVIQRAHAYIALLVCAVVLSTCVTIGKSSNRAPERDRGIKNAHAIHAETEIGCTDCHEQSTDAPFGLTMPTHSLCSVCHEIPEDLTSEPESCTLCHTSESSAVVARARLLPEDVRFNHDPHTTAGLDCATCHTDLDKPVAMAGGFKAACMDCHGKTNPQLNECSVCHNELSKDVVPTTRNGQRIAHDSPEIWAKIHGQESYVDPQYCSMCHDTVSSSNACDACHAENAPQNHTAAWRRKTHGLEAQWDRRSCAACHEENSCMQCHRSTEPASHRGAWGRPVQRHCVTCHFPEEQTNCTTCHESIDHHTALPSPHVLGIYPVNCARCHPGGLPNLAPHALNSTVRCAECHN
jgi:hypothetical protein